MSCTGLFDDCPEVRLRYARDAGAERCDRRQVAVRRSRLPARKRSAGGKRGSSHAASSWSLTARVGAWRDGAQTRGSERRFHNSFARAGAKPAVPVARGALGPERFGLRPERHVRAELHRRWLRRGHDRHSRARVEPLRVPLAYPGAPATPVRLPPLLALLQQGANVEPPAACVTSIVSISTSSQ